MAADGHQELRELLGAYALGALSADDVARVRAHLAGCPECRELLDELAPVAAALPAVDPGQVTGTDERVPTPQVGPLLARVGRERRRRRRRRVAGAAGALAAVAAAAVIAVAVWPVGAPEAPLRPVGDERALSSLRQGVSGSVLVIDRKWGAQLTLTARGLPSQERVVVWLERRDGRRVPAGTVNGLGDQVLRADLAAAVRPRDVVSIGVSDAAGRDLLAARVRG